MPIPDSVPDPNKGEHLRHPGHESGYLYTTCSAHIQNLILKTDTNELIYRLTDFENKPMVTKGKMCGRDKLGT